jgi:hypothetical protein
MIRQRHLRNAALLIGAYGALQTLWLAVALVQAGPRSGWWLELGLYLLMMVTAFFLLRGSDLARITAVLIFGGAAATGLATLADAVIGGDAPAWTALAQDGVRLVAGLYGLWALLLSPARASTHDDGRVGLPVALALLVAVAAAVGWYLDGLSVDILRTLGLQVAIAGAFILIIGFMAARRGQTALKWEYAPLVLAAVLVVANLESIQDLRRLGPVSTALGSTAEDLRPAFAARLQGKAGDITRGLADAREDAITKLDSAMRAISPIPLMTVLAPNRGGKPDQIQAASRTLAAKDQAAARTMTQVDGILAEYAAHQRETVAGLSDLMRGRLERLFATEREAYRSHYGARIHLLLQARREFDTLITVLREQEGRYTVDWRGAYDFEDEAAAKRFDTARAALEELALWDARLRTEGVNLQARYPAWRWLDAAD